MANSLTAVGGMKTAYVPDFVSDSATVQQLTVSEAINFSNKGTVTQLTDTITGVTLNSSIGVISCFTSTAAAGVAAKFIVTNSTVLATSHVLVSTNYATALTGTPCATVSVIDTGVFTVTVTNIHASAALNGVVEVFFMVV